MKPRKCLAVVALFALAMAWVESAVVFYLRTMIDRIEPYQAHPLPMAGGFGLAEFVREAATIIMLATVGWLAGRNDRSRFSYFLFGFGIWDIAYYAFLKVLTPWPRSLLDWDVLFLIPLPWWGPVLAPCLIALLMVAIGTLVTQTETEQRQHWPSGLSWGLAVAGAGVALFTFMTDTLAAAPGGIKAVREVLPASFNWPVFLAGWALMAAPVVSLARQLSRWPRADRAVREGEPSWSDARTGGATPLRFD